MYVDASVVNRADGQEWDYCCCGSIVCMIPKNIETICNVIDCKRRVSLYMGCEGLYQISVRSGKEKVSASWKKITNQANYQRTIPRNPNTPRKREIPGWFLKLHSTRIGWTNGHKIRWILKHPSCIATNITSIRFIQTILDKTEDMNQRSKRQMYTRQTFPGVKALLVGIECFYTTLQDKYITQEKSWDIARCLIEASTPNSFVWKCLHVGCYRFPKLNT